MKFLVSDKISEVCNCVEQLIARSDSLFECLNEAGQYLAMDSERLIWIFKSVCDSWRGILVEIKHLRSERALLLSCRNTMLKRVLEDCLQDYEMGLSVVEALDDTLSQAYYEHKVLGNLTNIASLCLWQSEYCKQYPLKKVNMQLVEKLNLIQYEILCIEEIISSLTETKKIIVNKDRDTISGLIVFLSLLFIFG